MSDGLVRLDLDKMGKGSWDLFVGATDSVGNSMPAPTPNSSPQASFVIDRSPPSLRVRATALDWVEASGDGVVYSTTVVRRRPERGGDHNVALIDLAEGVRMMSRVEGPAPEAVRIGMAVRAYVGTIDGRPAVLFRPAEA